jgi:hypothetical protein
MDKREQRWAKEDAERESYRIQTMGEVSAEKLACLQEIWAEADLRRLRHRVSARKEISKARPKAETKISLPKLSLTERRQREDDRIKASHQKQDETLAEKWRFEDIKRIAKRKAQEHLLYLSRCEQAFKLAERRNQEDEIAIMKKHDGSRLRPAGPLPKAVRGSAPLEVHQGTSFRRFTSG